MVQVMYFLEDETDAADTGSGGGIEVALLLQVVAGGRENVQVGFHVSLFLDKI
jgi:hypothetical protein